MHTQHEHDHGEIRAKKGFPIFPSALFQLEIITHLPHIHIDTRNEHVLDLGEIKATSNFFPP